MPRIEGAAEFRSIAAILVATFLAACANTEPASEPGGRNISDHSTGKVKAKATWQEGNVSLPPYPDEADLTEFQVSGRNTFKFFTDLKAVRVDEDRVVRLTVVARSGSGVENVSFEGIRCETGEFKIYAFGSMDRNWLPQRDAKWTIIDKSNDNDYHYTLRHYYLCLDGTPPRNARAAVWVLRQGALIIDQGRW